MFSQLSDLMAFYLIVSIMILVIALFYWADAIREKSDKSKKK